jgi:protein gp37
MGDLFHKDVNYDTILSIWQVMAKARRHIFLVLTKRPERMEKVVGFIYGDARPHWDDTFQVPLPNIWLGVSVENQATADERIPLLSQTPAAVRFVSYEPALEAVILPSHSGYVYPDGFENNGPMYSTLGYAHEPDAPIDWVIVGGESGPGARPMHPRWARAVRDQCQAAGMPYFYKQHGAWLHESQFLEPVTIHTPNIVTFEERNYRVHCWPDDSQSYRVGKKAAGRLLDGREWNEMPIIQEAK